MKGPLVSIIIPTYNHEKYISRCIESVRSQTYESWEMIAVDDCSTDGTLRIIEGFGDRRISCIRHKSNYGKERLSDSHNEALSVARGEFVTVLEGDDYWPEDRLERQVKLLSSSSAVLVHGSIALDKEGCITVWKGGQSCGDEIMLNKPRGNILRAFLSGMNPIYAQSVMIRKSALDKAGGFTQNSSLYLVDFPTWMELALQGEFVFVPEVLGYWRRYPSSLTSLYQKELLLGFIDCINIFIDNRRKEIESCPTDLSIYENYPAAHAYGALFKLSLLQGVKRDARKYLMQAWKRRSALFVAERKKLLLLSPFAFIPGSESIYKKYIAARTSRFSPFLAGLL